MPPFAQGCLWVALSKWGQGEAFFRVGYNFDFLLVRTSMFKRKIQTHHHPVLASHVTQVLCRRRERRRRAQALVAEMKQEYQSAMTVAAARGSADVTFPNCFLDRVKAQVQAAVKAGDKSLETGGWGRGQLRTHLNRICQIAALAQSW